MKCGIDIVKIDRIQRLADRHSISSLERIFTSREIEICIDSKGHFKYPSLAARFACKEAVAKALGTGFGIKGVSASDIEILKNGSGAPYVILYGNTKEYFDKNGYTSIEISLSHTEETAAAMCVIM
jgi:holo-[acyl-carrier protein] synthase